MYHKSLIYLATEFMKELLCYLFGALSDLLNKESDKSGMAVGEKKLAQLQGLSAQVLCGPFLPQK